MNDQLSQREQQLLQRIVDDALDQAAERHDLEEQRELANISRKLALTSE